MSQHVLASDVLHQYLALASTPVSPIQQRLQAATHEQVEYSFMMTSPEQVQWLAQLITLIGAKRAIEVGVFTGYGTLAIAQALPKDGQLVACDIGEQWPAIGQPFWEEAGVADKIQLHIAPAEQTLRQLVAANQLGQYDFAFIDADKIHYPVYYELVLQLLRPNGVMIFDDVLRVNKVWVHDQANPATRSVFQFTQALQQDARVDVSIIPLSHGMLMIRKL